MVIPTTLAECIETLSKNAPPDDLIDFALMEENKAVSSLHFSMGMAMRNSWGLWGNNLLTRWFNSLGIYHADDMSGIINTSFHRHLNKKDIDLLGQVKIYRDYWIIAGYKDGNPKNPRNYE